jgi:N-ethylmaleimide reductase
MSQSPLFEPTELGALELKNRIVLAPLTRSRANEMGVPADFAPVYYAQRAQAGLLISEATQVSFEGMGYPRTPGVHTDDQIAAWKRVTDAVHAVGGKIVVQLWHTGRISCAINRGEPVETVAPSAVQAAGEMYTDAKGMQPHDMPRALETDEIARIGQDYANAAVRAQEAGFDGVEFHSANGYLMHQFLSSNANQRTDKYGGSIENRIRAPLEVLDAILAKVPAGKVGLRVSPGHTFNDIVEDDTDALYAAYYAALNTRGLAYLHVMRPFANKGGDDADPVAHAQAHYNGRLVVCGGYDKASGEAAIRDGVAAVAYGRTFIANPDLPLRFALDAPLTEPDGSTFYTPGPKGYTDYPVYDAT